jgi:hypothetical protein
VEDPILDEIWRVREKLVKEHGGLQGYLKYMQKLDLARRRRDKRRKAAISKKKTPPSRTQRG